MVDRIIRALLFLGSAFAIVAFTLISIRLLGVAHPLDPVEISVLERAGEFARGGSVYLEPSRPDDPALMPGFPLAAAPLVQAFGPEVWVPRALALACLFGIGLLVLAIVRLETASWTLAVTSVGFLALGFNLLAAPPGLARPELLMLLFALAAFLVLRLSHGMGGAVVAAVLGSAAFFTDAQAVWFLAAALFSLALDERRRLLAFTLVTGVCVGGGYVLLSRALGPWFNFSAWGDPGQLLRWNPVGPLQYVGDDLLGKLGVLTLATVLSFALPVAPWRGKTGLWMCMGAAAVAAGLLSTQTAEFGPATLIPSLVALAMVGPVSMQRVTGHLSAWPGSSRMSGQGVVLTALTLQFIMFFACSLTGLRLLE
jgi:hypothetical protein